MFFSRITLEDKLGQEYEPYIFAALNSAKIMPVAFAVMTVSECDRAIAEKDFSTVRELCAKVILLPAERKKVCMALK